MIVGQNSNLWVLSKCFNPPFFYFLLKFNQYKIQDPLKVAGYRDSDMKMVSEDYKDIADG